MDEREERLEKLKQILLNNIKKKVEKVEDNTEEKDGKLTDPLKNAKAIIKHYGTHNRLK